MTGMATPAPIKVSEGQLDDLRERLVRTRWPDNETVDDWSQGAPLGRVRALCGYWRERYDWRRCEAMLNSWAPHRIVLAGLGIHFFHIRSPEPAALPLLMTHGWPGSAIEFHKVIGPLTDPARHGADPADAVHLVLPALPGYGFSDKPTGTGWNLARIATAWAQLMHQLGYGDRWAAQGGDWGAQVTSTLASQQPRGLIGVHLNGHAWSPTDAQRAEANEDEQRMLARRTRFDAELSGYMKLQGTRPQTIGASLADSPAGQAAWIYEKCHDWTDCDGDPDSLFTADELLDNIMLYWLPNAAASSARLYWEVAHAPVEAAPVDVPLAFTRFPADIGGPSRRWAERRFRDLVSWREAARGGHFAAWEQPAIFTDEVRAGLAAVQGRAAEFAPPPVHG